MSFTPAFTRKYEVQRVLGEGGMSRVYLALEVELHRTVAIKFIQPAGGFGDGMAERLLEEARVCAAIKHPNVVRVYGEGTEQGAPYVVFEYVPGASLEQELKSRGALGVERALQLMRGILAGLAAAHELGVVHRDIKPANILIHASTGEPMLMDFGVAKASAGRQVTTQAGMLLGTPAYMAPEQILGEALTPAVDVYAAGVMLFECLAGRGPFQAASEVALLSSHVHLPAPELTTLAPHVPPHVSAVVARALAKAPSERYVDAGAMRAALDDPKPEPRSVPPSEPRSVPPSGLRSQTRPERPASRAEPLTARTARMRAHTLTGSREATARPHGAGKRVLVLALVALVPAALIAGALAWFTDRSVHDVRFVADDDGRIEVRWTTRHAGRGWVGVLARGVRGSTVTSHEPEDTTAHHAVVSGLAPGPYGVAVLASDGQPVWSDTVEVPPRGSARTTPPRAPGGPWEVTAPAGAASHGVLTIPATPEPLQIRSDSAKKSGLVFRAPFPADGPPPGTVISMDERPGHTVRYRLDRSREVGEALAASLLALDVPRIAAEIARLPAFQGKVELMFAGRAKSAKEAQFPGILAERLQREHVLEPLRAFAPVARTVLARADTAAARIYERLLDVEALEALILAQHEPVPSPVRALYAPLVEVEHRGAWLAPARASASAIPLTTAPQIWVPADYETFGLFTLWLTEQSHIADLVHLPSLSESALRRAAVTTARYDPKELESLRSARRVRFRMVFALLGPAYYFRVRFRGASGASFPLHVGHAGTPEWFAAMDHKRPASVPEVPGRPPRIYWGEALFTFPSKMLPPGRLSVEVTNEHVPGVPIIDLSYPVNRAAVVAEITVAPVD